MENKVIGFSSKKEQFLKEAVAGLEDIIANIENGNLVSYLTVAYSPVDGVIVYYSKPEGMSTYELMGHSVMLTDYLKMKAAMYD
jgi:uncharacterized protein YvpB